MQPPPTQYVERDGVSIAYQVVGDGPVDLLYAPGFISHLDLQWTEPRFSGFLARLASFSRLILYDKPGTGLSDPIPHLPTLEELQQRFLGTFARAAASPRMARALIETVLQIDVRDVLASVRVPTLVLHIGARVSALAGPGEIAVSSTVKELVVGSGMQFADNGEHELKGVPGSWRIYTLGKQRTPLAELDSAAAYMRRSDRVAVTLARRIPRAMRLAGQLRAAEPSRRRRTS